MKKISDKEINEMKTILALSDFIMKKLEINRLYKNG